MYCYLTIPSILILYNIVVRMNKGHGTVGGMRISRENLNTLGKHTVMPLCPPQIPLHLIQDHVVMK
jgi:hypothetical protein